MSTSEPRFGGIAWNDTYKEVTSGIPNKIRGLTISGSKRLANYVARTSFPKRADNNKPSRPKTNWIILAMTMVILAGIVGASVGSQVSKAKTSPRADPHTTDQHSHSSTGTPRSPTLTAQGSSSNTRDSTTHSHSSEPSTIRDSSTSVISSTNIPYSTIEGSTSATSIVTSISPTSSQIPSHTWSTSAPYFTPSGEAKLASINWYDQTGNLQYRVYSQSVDGSILESYWSSDVGTWATKYLPIAKGRIATPLAATISPNPGPKLINLYYISDDGTLCEAIHQNDEPNVPDWYSGHLINLQIKPSSNTELATLWVGHHDCITCFDDLLVLMQQSDESLYLIDVGNGYITPTYLPGKPIVGSSLSPITWSTSGREVFIRLYYQIASGQFTSISWRSSESQLNVTEDWNLEGVYVFGSHPLQTRLSCFTLDQVADLYQTGTACLLSDGSVQAKFLDCAGQSFEDSQIPPIMQSLPGNAPLAVTANGHAFAFNNGVIQDFEISSDGLNWTFRNEFNSP